MVLLTGRGEWVLNLAKWSTPMSSVPPAVASVATDDQATEGSAEGIGRTPLLLKPLADCDAVLQRHPHPLVPSRYRPGLASSPPARGTPAGPMERIAPRDDDDINHPLDHRYQATPALLPPPS